MMAKVKPPVDRTTEEKIKDAASRVFTKKGYAATRTRDIAEEAGLNLALLNYYFRSKEKLFEVVMTEKLQKMFGVIVPIINDEGTTLEKKIERIAGSYIDMISANMDLPIFVLSELRNHPERFGSRLQVGRLLRESVLIRQLQEKRPDVRPLHFMMSILGMTIFPFIAMPVFQAENVASRQVFHAMMEERKTLIPKWVKAMLKAK